MKTFIEFIREFVETIEMQDKLVKMGYKVKPGPTKKILLVYVPSSERESTLKSLADKFSGGVIDDSRKSTNISSIGAVITSNGTLIAVKPDKDRVLSTDEQESLAGLYLATILNNSNTNFSYDDLVKYGNPHLYSKYKAENIFEKSSKSWIKSATVTAKTLYNRFAGLNLEVHQRSSSRFVTNISNAAMKLIKNSGTKIKLDKWNPSDIWLVNPRLVNTDFSKFETISELNGWIAENYRNKTLIGVSLKAVGNTAKIEEFNLEAAPPRNIKFERYDLGKTGFVSAMDMNIYFEDGLMNIRSFGRPQNVSGDIAGKKARGGKIGAGQLFSVIRKHNPNFSTPSDRQIAAEFSKNPRLTTDKLYKKMHMLVSDEAKRYTADDFYDAITKKGNALTYVISKTQVTDIAIAINGMSTNQKNEMLGDMFDYAASSLPISSVFIKVS